MDRPELYSKVRRYIAYISPYGITQLQFKNPYVIAWWSLAFPGLGHIMIGKYLRGYFLFCWEITINYYAHINLALLYSFTGQFQMAKDILNIQWVLLYIPTYLFIVWDSYRSTVALNQQYILGARENAQVKSFNISLFDINFLDKRIPWHSAMWSVFMPGLGQASNWLPYAFFITIWSIFIIIQSELLPAIHYTLLGQFNSAKAIIDPQWFLNLPSIYFYSIYDAYAKTVSLNKLFDWEQAKYLKNNYQSKEFLMPFCKGDERGKTMYIVSTFDHSTYLELAITAIQMNGVPKENILGVSMEKRDEESKLFDTIHSSDGLSLFDLPIILATLFCLFGSIYGFVLTWGPILWGIIGIILGFTAGLIIRLIIRKDVAGRQKKQRSPEVVLIIECEEHQLEVVKDLLWQNHALGVRKLILN
ncbi:hypothetical protein [Desulfosporosinus meridiei]|uniref:Uncharacterized protein n=1 Tax=Desulfosporosinus meridiei (strain ATCC BAA-275 / DSM 13257 / KCTC 12902 / NCIMB 13706 / S10) TaxID=768704 RepID=J7J0I8_DESMD|nr:hypothetical protein [Desulfosporosinus meridiei]AFQ44798.1 hypothetical protein Desmer_2907 [Desulfosporosinus meridiei DSM 13257]